MLTEVYMVVCHFTMSYVILDFGVDLGVPVICSNACFSVYTELASCMPCLPSY